MQQFATSGKFLSEFAVSPFPGGIALDGHGNVYVAHGGIPPSKYDEERKRDKIAVFSAAGEPIRDWGKFGEEDGEFDLPEESPFAMAESTSLTNATAASRSLTRTASS